MISGLSNTPVDHSPHVALIELTFREDQRGLTNEGDTAAKKTDPRTSTPFSSLYSAAQLPPSGLTSDDSELIQDC